MNSECLRIADQLRRAFSGDAWHGPPLRELLDGVSAEQASSRPLPEKHSIWELVTHIDIYVRITIDAIHGTPMPNLYQTGADWPTVADSSETAWMETAETLFRRAESLAAEIERLNDDKLRVVGPGRTYDFYYLFHGVIQHSLYHGGQIALLKRARL